MLRKICLFLNILLTSSFVSAGEVMTSYQSTKHPGFLHWEKSQQLKGPEAVVEMSQVILSYEKEPNKALIDTKALRESLDSLIYICSGDGAPKSINCEDILTRGLQIYRKHWESDFLEATNIHQTESSLGDFFFKKGNNLKALEFYNKAYPHLAKSPCDNSHLFLLAKIMNVHLRMGNKTSFDQLWKWSEYCEKSGKTKDAKLIHNLQKNEVHLQMISKPEQLTANNSTAPNAQDVRPMKSRRFADSAALLQAIKNNQKESIESYKKYTNDMRTKLKKAMTAEEQKKLNKDIKNRESEVSQERQDFEKIKNKDPKIKEFLRLRNIGNLARVKLGMTKEEIIAIFGKSDPPDSPNELDFKLVIQEPYANPVTAFLPEGGASSSSFTFTFSTQGKLIRFSTVVGGKEFLSLENWIVEDVNTSSH